MKNTNYSKILSVSNPVELSIICNKSFDSYSLASQTAERFIQSANMLSANDYLGFSFNTVQEEELKAYAFSNSEENVTYADYEWIFKKCAKTDCVSIQSEEEQHNSVYSIYALTYSPEKSLEVKSELFEFSSSSAENNYMSDTISILKDMGAELRLISKGNSGGQGIVLIYLREKISLRLRTMLSLGCPKTQVIEITDSEIMENEDIILPASCLSSIIAGVLDYMIDNQPAVEENIETDLLLEDEDPEKDSGKKDTNMPIFIEDMDLSIRAYNCLSRAGIFTVAELREKTDEELFRVRNLGKKCIAEIREKLSKISVMESVPEKKAVTYFEMLDELVGLENVKEQVKKITAFARMKQDMESLNHKSTPIVLNMGFIGNPGTAKTTVARIVAGILNEIGLLNSNELIEVGRADLVAHYVGQTADKVKAVFHEAKGKLLFIDEAYSLVDSYKNGFGDEAINTIVQEMENNRKDTIVIFAGYPDEMKEFFMRNPGLKSRVPFTIQFPDYSVEELVRITELEAEKRGFSISSQALESIESVCSMVAQNFEKDNGRFCRNLTESAILNYAYRTYGENGKSSENGFTLTEEDFSIFNNQESDNKKCSIGFRA